DEFKNLPGWMKFHFEVLGPGSREDFRIVDGDLVRDSSWIDIPQTFDHMYLVAVNSQLIGFGVMSCIKHPFLQTDGIDHKSVAFPLSDGVAHPGLLDILLMWPAIRGNHAEEMHVLVQDHDLTRRLNPLLSIRRQNLPGQAVRQTTRCGIVFDRITGR